MDPVVMSVVVGALVVGMVLAVTFAITGKGGTRATDSSPRAGAASAKR